jgi:hypothetical protein
MQARLWSVNALAVELGFDRRSLSRKLEGLRPTEEETKGARTERRYRLAAVFQHLSRGTQHDGAAPDQMSPKERLDHYRAERECDKLATERGQLIEAHEFERAFADAIKTVATALESLPDVLERDAGIDGRAVERCQEVIDRQREELYRRLSGE